MRELPRRYHPSWVVAMATVIVSLMTEAGAVALTSPYEDQVKAAFLFNFTKFVTWPDEAFPDRQAPIRIGVLNQDELRRHLEKATSGQKVSGREVAVIDLEDVSGSLDCQILYVGETAVSSFQEGRQRLRQTPVLIIGETDGFAENGGIINFIRVDNKVRFEINVAAAAESGLQISSKLLSLAEIVGDSK
jgi:hypothetical protein